MKAKIFAVGIAVMFCLMTSFTALGQATTNEVYDFDEGEFPNIFVPFNQSVESWNDFTGLELEDGDWLNITYTNITGDDVSILTEVFDEDEYIDVSFDIDVWTNITGYGLISENFTASVEVAVNNKSRDTYLPLIPYDFTEDDWFDGAIYSIVPVGDNLLEFSDITIEYFEEYEPDDDVLEDTGVNWTDDDEPAIVFTYDDVEVPLTDFGFYYFEDEEIYVQVGEVAEDDDTLSYVIITNYDVGIQSKAASQTRRYWGQEGASFTAKYITGSKNTFTQAAGTDYSIFDVPDDNIARIKVGTGATRDYRLEMSGDGSYEISRMKRAWGTAEAIADLATTNSDVLAIENVYFSRIWTIEFEYDSDDLVEFTEDVVFMLDNTYDYGVSNWYIYGTKHTSWAVTGFTWF